MHYVEAQRNASTTILSNQPDIVVAGHEGRSGSPDAALRIAEFGVDMFEKVKSIKPPNGMQLQIRVGIHTGPAYSGVVGTKVPKYTFFGDSKCRI